MHGVFFKTSKIKLLMYIHVIHSLSGELGDVRKVPLATPLRYYQVTATKETCNSFTLHAI